MWPDFASKVHLHTSKTYASEHILGILFRHLPEPSFAEEQRASPFLDARLASAPAPSAYVEKALKLKRTVSRTRLVPASTPVSVPSLTDSLRTVRRPPGRPHAEVSRPFLAAATWLVKLTALVAASALVQVRPRRVQDLRGDRPQEPATARDEGRVAARAFCPPFLYPLRRGPPLADGRPLRPSNRRRWRRKLPLCFNLDAQVARLAIGPLCAPGTPTRTSCTPSWTTRASGSSCTPSRASRRHPSRTWIHSPSRPTRSPRSSEWRGLARDHLQRLTLTAPRRPRLAERLPRSTCPSTPPCRPICPPAC